MRPFNITNLPLFIAVAVLWLLAKNVSLRPPITAAMIVDALLFILLLVWMVVAVLGLAH